MKLNINLIQLLDILPSPTCLDSPMWFLLHHEKMCKNIEKPDNHFLPMTYYYDFKCHVSRPSLLVCNYIFHLFIYCLFYIFKTLWPCLLWPFNNLGVSWGNNPRSIMFSDLLVKSISEGLDNFIRSMISELSSCKFVSLPRSFTCSSCSKSLLVLPLGRVWHGEIEQHLWSFSYWGGEIERSSPCMGCRSSSELEQVIVFL